ncbi:PepSY-associated TM helix domain-containing protein [Qipengyuania qiaonensis]|uniref:PepSY domain-containing protein n=1 Tax=Qipengyuania qiaonensis TaxID=2867240 RepID=A0ABS7J2Z6_9SPHN|nr:PepSY domain-containing protein [Qipengyuania qiaonensis]MBX7481689.1 PepSY domain-containing protein [Qipengyuania qiaonensis]
MTRRHNASREVWLRTVWRWHFYAGLFAIPFILWLSATGAIYLFKPQIEAWLDRPYDNLAVTGAPLAPSELAQRAQAAVPGAVLHRFVLRAEPDDAQRIIVGKGAVETRIYLHPETGDVLKIVGEEDRLMRVVFRLHGELMMGRWGSLLVETAASWTIMLLLTGLYLWWPRGRRKRAGVLYPRLAAGGRLFWRDLHAVTGLWVSLAALLLIFSGLPWAKNWGDYLDAVRAVTGQNAETQEWSRGAESDAQQRLTLDRSLRAAMNDHAHHAGMTGGDAMPDVQIGREIDRVAATALGLHLPQPVEIAPPTAGSRMWQARSMTADRPERAEVEIDGSDGRVIGRRDFSDRHWIDRTVGYGIALHEGALFGLANQLAGALTLLGLVTLAVSSIILWWRRRPVGVLGAPPSIGPAPRAPALVAAVLGLALLVPMFGLTLALIVFFERVAVRRLPRIADWLGLRQQGVMQVSSASLRPTTKGPNHD